MHEIPVTRTATKSSTSPTTAESPFDGLRNWSKGERDLGPGDRWVVSGPSSRLAQDQTYPEGRNPDWPKVVTKAKRLDAANQERAEAAVRWEDTANTANETGRASDQTESEQEGRVLDAVDRKTKRIEAEP